MVLDAPPLEWRSLIRHDARRDRLLPLAGTVAWSTVLKSGQELDATDPHSVMDRFTTPMLLHGGADRLMRVAHVERLAPAGPDTVEDHRVEGAAHVRPWNIGPERGDPRALRAPGPSRDWSWRTGPGRRSSFLISSLNAGWWSRAFLPCPRQRLPG
ncbi:hypothetical protein [Deinococcus aestuarii]|uniref:hypothetical protein n=1 Tax=Deinococcus aestuarii TaxID=2774531 RepID=UPI001C0C38A6|nr:hypothetical protein [Deinococcus aestuarii]